MLLKVGPISAWQGIPAQDGGGGGSWSSSPSLQPSDRIGSGYFTTPLKSSPSMTFSVRHYDHRLFQGGRRVIPGVGKSEPWMRHNALELLGLHGISEIAKMEPGTEFLVAATMSSNLMEIRGFQLRESDSSKGESECLMTVQKTQSLLRFLNVNVAGLPPEQIAWFMSLGGRFVHQKVFEGELISQAADNEAAFRTFYREQLQGIAPSLFTRLNAWIGLDSGRVVDVSHSSLPTKKNDGVQAQFASSIEDGAACMTCTSRRGLHGMPGLWLAYFEKPIIMVRDVVATTEDARGVPGAEVDGVSSNAVVGDGTPEVQNNDIVTDEATGSVAR